MSEDEEFRQMVADFANGLTDAIIMHVDTIKLLSRKEWELLKAAGATAVVIHKELPANER